MKRAEIMAHLLSCWMAIQICKYLLGCLCTTNGFTSPHKQPFSFLYISPQPILDSSINFWGMIASFPSMFWKQVDNNAENLFFGAFFNITQEYMATCFSPGLTFFWWFVADIEVYFGTNEKELQEKIIMRHSFTVHSNKEKTNSSPVSFKSRSQ